MTVLDQHLGTVYLIHFDQPIGGEGRNGAQHYIGWANGDYDQRLADHRAGRGAKILAFLVANGIGFDVVTTWVADRNFERRLKKNGNFKRHCPVCKDHGSVVA